MIFLKAQTIFGMKNRKKTPARVNNTNNICYEKVQTKYLQSTTSILKRNHTHNGDVATTERSSFIFSL